MATVPMARFEAFQKVAEDQFQEMGAQVATLRTDMGVSMARIEQETMNFGEAVAKNLVDAKTQIDTLKGDLIVTINGAREEFDGVKNLNAETRGILEHVTSTILEQLTSANLKVQTLETNVK